VIRLLKSADVKLLSAELAPEFARAVALPWSSRPPEIERVAALPELLEKYLPNQPVIHADATTLVRGAVIRLEEVSVPIENEANGTKPSITLRSDSPEMSEGEEDPEGVLERRGTIQRNSRAPACAFQDTISSLIVRRYQLHEACPSLVGSG